MIAKNLTEWHRLVCEREGYRCQGVGCRRDYSSGAYFLDDGRNAYVCGHHDIRQGADIRHQLDTDNGICTCSECHVKHHNGCKKYVKNSK